MWYVLQVKTGEELTVRNSLQCLGFLSSSPQESRMIRQSGKWNSKDYVLFPNYVFVELEYNAENYYRVKAVPGVIKFLGAGSTPSPLTYHETEWLKDLTEKDNQPLQPTKVRKNEDGSIEILEGVLKRFPAKLIRFGNVRGRRATLEITVGDIAKEVQLSIEFV